LLENFIADSKAVNLPEFVNIGFNKWKSIQLDFLKPLSIEKIDFKNVRDGIFKGSYQFNGIHLKLVSATLEIIVAKKKIKEINLKESQGISKKSEEILKKIIQLQSIDVLQLAVTSNEELVLLKAVEDGLLKGNLQ
jgi:uncharacterized protein with FMN-binding domain